MRIPFVAKLLQETKIALSWNGISPVYNGLFPLTLVRYRM